MIDFTPLRSKERTMRELVAGLKPDDLRRLTDEMINTQLNLIAECTDADVTFEPSDPGANDPVAATEAELNMPWTLGHLIVHVTASSEEAAAIAAELARGVAHRGGRSRSEVHWTTITTVAQCQRQQHDCHDATCRNQADEHPSVVDANLRGLRLLLRGLCPFVSDFGHQSSGHQPFLKLAQGRHDFCVHHLTLAGDDLARLEIVCHE